jgi:hypothetical protein
LFSLFPIITFDSPCSFTSYHSLILFFLSPIITMASLCLVSSNYLSSLCSLY